MKYIDAEKLRKLLANRYEKITVPVLTDEGGLESFYRRSEIHDILKIVDSLQQEQNSIQDTELTGFESALFTAFSYAWQSYLRGEEVDVVQWVKDCSKDLLEAARCQQEQQKVDLVAELKHHLATTPKEQLEKEWKELEPWNNIGPTVQEFLYGKKPEVDLEKEIEWEWVHREKQEVDLIECAEMDKDEFVRFARHFAEWQEKQKCHGCFNRDEVFMRGMKYAKEQMMKEAVEGEVCGRVYDHINVRFADGVYKYLEPKNISHIPADMSKYNIGDKVRIVVLKAEEE